MGKRPDTMIGAYVRGSPARRYRRGRQGESCGSVLYPLGPAQGKEYACGDSYAD